MGLPLESHVILIFTENVLTVLSETYNYLCQNTYKTLHFANIKDSYI